MSDIQDLKILRNKIDEIDERLLDLLIKRAKVSAEVGEIKKDLNLEIFSRDRETEILKKLQKRCALNNLNYDYVKNIWNIIFNKSHEIQIEGVER